MKGLDRSLRPLAYSDLLTCEAPQLLVTVVKPQGPANQAGIVGSIEEKVEAVNSYLERLESDPRRVRSLAGWDWIDDAIESLPSSYAASSH